MKGKSDLVEFTRGQVEVARDSNELGVGVGREKGFVNGPQLRAQNVRSVTIARVSVKIWRVARGAIRYLDIHRNSVNIGLAL